MRLAWQLHDGEGPALLLVHGFLTSPRQWLLNLPALARHCRPVTVALWGHGGAPAPVDPALYHPDAYVEEFERIRDELALDHWFLLGYSLGAGLTIRYALTHPERIAGHIFTNSTSALADRVRVAEIRSGAAAAAEHILDGGHAAMARIPVHPRHARKLPGLVYDALVADAAHHAPSGIANTIRYTSPESSVRDELPRNRRPALLVCGSRERRFQPLRTVAAETMPGLEIVDLDAGHGMNMERPEEFNAAVAAFIARCERRLADPR
jgi:2-succinyl-6-hydroxy-2,4-cyclohexadiene-1-carboxylate synthase